MSKSLIIVESPKKAREIQKYLGDSYIVRASQGHICDLDSTPSNRFGIDILNGFKPSYRVLEEKKDHVRVMKEAALEAKEIYLAPDPDREGEAIGFFIAEQLKAKVPVKRVMFHEITKTGIKKGLSEPRLLDMNLVQAQQARRVLDRLVGFLVSPIVIKLFGPHLSAGRVQSVALRLIVDREREIESFVPEEYWSIAVNLAKDSEGEKFIARYHGERVEGKEQALKIKSDLESDTYVVSEVIAETKDRKPPPPLDTAALQKVASIKCKLSSDRAMKAAQRLYESGYVTYIRTDSIRSAPESIEDLRAWLSKQGYQIPDKPVIYAAKASAQNAHEAIRPTQIDNIPSQMNLSDDEKKVYTIIWERFVASQMKPALYDTVTVVIKTSSNYFFKATGKILKCKGWTEILPQKEEDSLLPELIKGDNLLLVPPKVKCEQKFTQPPSRYKVHSMVEELEAKGIGRPSTYANILSKVTDRHYVECKQDTFYATELGKKVVDLLKKHFSFMEYKYTSQMEAQLDQIAEGKLDYVGMLDSFYQPFKEQLKISELENEIDFGIKCPKCNKRMRLKNGPYGAYMACMEYPHCSVKISCDVSADGKQVTLKKTNILPNIRCKKCDAPVKSMIGKYGPFLSCIKCHAGMPAPTNKYCKVCSKELYYKLINEEAFLACSGYPSCSYKESTEKVVKISKVVPSVIKKYLK